MVSWIINMMNAQRPGRDRTTSTRRGVRGLAKGVGRRLRGLRQAKRLRLVDLARGSGVDAATISRIETGSMVGTLTAHARLAHALGIDLAALFADVPIRPTPSSPSVLETRLLRLLKGRSEPELALALGLLEAAFHWVGTSRSSKRKH